jgi:hypothetical protein
MSFIKELERLQQNIKELNQTFEALTESVERYQNTRKPTRKQSPPEWPSDLHEPDPIDLVDPEPRLSIDEISPREWDAISKRFYQEPK